ncbi:hypothetical protein T31B1_15970 [Salinisphaera sp. T31B1]
MSATRDTIILSAVVGQRTTSRSPRRSSTPAPVAPSEADTGAAPGKRMSQACARHLHRESRNRHMRVPSSRQRGSSSSDGGRLFDGFAPTTGTRGCGYAVTAHPSAITADDFATVTPGDGSRAIRTRSAGRAAYVADGRFMLADGRDDAGVAVTAAVPQSTPAVSRPEQATTRSACWPIRSVAVADVGGNEAYATAGR